MDRERDGWVDRNHLGPRRSGGRHHCVSRGRQPGPGHTSRGDPRQRGGSIAGAGSRAVPLRRRGPLDRHSIGRRRRHRGRAHARRLRMVGCGLRRVGRSVPRRGHRPGERASRRCTKPRRRAHDRTDRRRRSHQPRASRLGTSTACTGTARTGTGTARTRTPCTSTACTSGTSRTSCTACACTPVGPCAGARHFPGRPRLGRSGFLSDRHVHARGPQRVHDGHDRIPARTMPRPAERDADRNARLRDVRQPGPSRRCEVRGR